MVRTGRSGLAAALFLCFGAASFAQEPLVFAPPEPTPAGDVDLAPMGTLPQPPPPARSLNPAPAPQTIPMPQADPGPQAPAQYGTSVQYGDPAPYAAPQAACCGAAAAVAASGCCQSAPACQPAPVAPCCAAAPVTACGCAAGGAASFAAFAPAQMYPGGPNSGGACCGGNGGSMGVLAAPGYGAVGSGYGPVGVDYSGAGPGYGLMGQAGAPGVNTAFYAGGYATAGYGSAVSGAWPTYYGANTGAQAYSGFPMGYAAGGTAGEHIRNPYYNDRRPWYTPGPGARTVSIVW